MPDQPKGWKPELEQKALRESYAEEMGGVDKVARQKGRGKLTARDRIDGLLDEDSFREIGKLAGSGEYDETGKLIRSSASNFIYGQGAISGRPVVASADDFTVRGGASDAAIYRKFIHAELMASEFGIPLIRMIDGTGGGGSVKSLEAMGYTYVPEVPGFEAIVRNQETVPVVALALGPCAGLGAARVVASHYSVMVRGLSQVFTAGPAIVAPLGESLDKEGLGGSEIHTRNGVVDDEVGSEAEAWNAVETFRQFNGAKAEREAVAKQAQEELLKSLSEGFEETEIGLRYQIIQKGDGAKAEKGKTVGVHYKGMFADGGEFDNSYKRGNPIEFPVGMGNVIPGWDEGIQLLHVGDKARFVIPAHLGYGSRGAGGVIPPNATLVFDVELMHVK